MNVHIILNRFLLADSKDVAGLSVAMLSKSIERAGMHRNVFLCVHSVLLFIMGIVFFNALFFIIYEKENDLPKASQGASR